MEVNNAVKSKINLDKNGARAGFDRFHSSGPDSYFSTYKPQNSFSDNRFLSQSYNSFSEGPLQDAPLPYTVWPSQEDCKSVDWPQVISNSRNLVDASNCGSEADLYGLVSDILEEPDSMDPYSSYVSESRIPSGLKGVWSPKLVREDNMQYFNNEVQMPSIPGFSPNQICPKPVTNVCPQPAGRESHQWAELQNFNGFDSPCNFSSCNGEVDSYSPQDLPRPPGLKTPPALSSNLYQTRAGKPEYITPEKEEGYHNSTNCLSDYINTVNNSYCPPQKMDDSYFSSSPDFLSVSKDKLRNTQSFSVQDASKLAFLLAEQDMNYCGESTQNGLLAQRNHEEIMAEQKSHPFQRMSELISQTQHFKREVTRNHLEQRGAKAEDKKTLLKSNFNINEFSGLGLPKPFSPTVIPPALHLNKEVSPTGSSSAQTSGKQFQPIQSNRYQTQTKMSAQTNSNSESQGFGKLTSTSGSVPLLPSQKLFRPAGRVLSDLNPGSAVNLHGAIGQFSHEGLRKGAGNVDISDFDLQLENNRLSLGLAVDGCFTQRFGMKPKVTGFPKEAEKKAGLLQNPYQGLYGGQMRHNGASSNSAKATPSQLFPFLYQMGDPRKNACHVIQSQSSLPYCSVPFIDMNDRLSDGDVSPYLQECVGLNQTSGDGLLSGFLTAMTLPKIGKALGSPNSQLHFHLEECYDQWRMLEKERKKAEAVLMKTYAGKYVSVVTSSILPKMPPNPSRVDRLIVDQLREQAKVVGLLGKMEQLRSFPFHANIGSALDKHLEVVYITQARRRDEFINASNRQRQPATFYGEDREILLLASAVKDLCTSTRKARTALWCALQMTLPKTSTYSEEGQEKGICSPSGPDSPEQSSLERALASL